MTLPSFRPRPTPSLSFVLSPENFEVRTTLVFPIETNEVLGYATERFP